MIGWSFCRELGIWWLGIGRWRLVLRAPWDKPLFSERNRLNWVLRLRGGWRVQSRMKPAPAHGGRHVESIASASSFPATQKPEVLP